MDKNLLISSFKGRFQGAIDVKGFEIAVTVKPLLDRHGGLFFNPSALVAVYIRGGVQGWRSIFQLGQAFV